MSELDDLQQAVWEALAALGFDTNGDPTPAALVYPPLGELLVREARKAREEAAEDDAEYDQLLTSYSSLRAEVDRLRMELRYKRDVLVNTLVHHWPNEDSSCLCGWSKLGHSHPEHVADVYEKAVSDD